MGASKEEELVRELLREHGTKIRHTTHGVLWRLPGNQTVMAYADKAKKDLDPRAWKNQLADIRRALRAAGIGQEQEAVVDDKNGTDIFDAVIAAQHRLAALGVHVQRKQRLVEETEAVLDAQAMAALMGLVEPHEKGAKIEVLDVDGNPLQGPYTVKVRTERDA